MAAIDKTYVNTEEYIQAREFWIKTYKKQIRELGQAIWLYSFTALEGEVTPEILLNTTADIEYVGSESPLWNTSFLQDIWLYKNCKLNFVQERLVFQYGENYFDIYKDIDFKDKPHLMGFTLKGDSANYFYKDSFENFYEPINNILIYGTTLMVKAIHEIKTFLSEYGSELTMFEYLHISFYGLHVKYDFKKREWMLNSKVIQIPKFDLDFKINYSFKKSDLKKFKSESIFISTDDDISCLADFNKSNYEYLPSFGVPYYINELIK